MSPTRNMLVLHGVVQGNPDWLQVAKAMPDADHAYMEWVSTYSAPTYQEVPAKLEQLIEDVGNKVTYGGRLFTACSPGHVIHRQHSLPLTSKKLKLC